MKVRLFVGAFGMLAGVLIGLLQWSLAEQASETLVRPAKLVFQAEISTSVKISARQRLRRPITGTVSPLFPQVVGMPEAFVQPAPSSRYTYRNEFPEDRTKPLPLYAIDLQTGQETRLGDDTGAAIFGIQNESYLL